MSDPERSAASTTMTIPASAAMVRLRAGNAHRKGVVPGGSSETTPPASMSVRCSVARLRG